MNELDSELVSGQLRSLGYRFVSDPSQAQVVLYNTCSVREHAEQKVWSRLGELDARKRIEPGLVVGVLGCMAERDGKDLIRRMPVVDILCGPGELDKLPSLLDNAVRTRESLLQDDQAATTSAKQVALQGGTSRRSATLAAAEDSLEMLDLSRSISPIDSDAPVRRTAYVRITRGCNKFCTYCVVPFTRGAEIHRPPEHILDECKKLAAAGVIEITLLGQTVNHYRFEHGAAVTLNGISQPQKGRSYAGGHRRDPFAGERVTTFADLLRQIHEEVPEIARLRFVTSYPRDFGDDVLEVIRDHPRICRYLHVPAQSGSDRLLQKMNRGYTSHEYIDFIDRARSFLDQPEKNRPLTLSGDFIVGFPSETEEDFEATKQLLLKARYKNAFIFKYSPRPGTTAYDKFEDDVPEDVKRRRNNELLDMQTQMSEDLGRLNIGQTFDVMVEGVSRRELKKKGMTGSQIREAGAVAITIGGRSMAKQGLAATALLSHGDADETPIQFSARNDGDLIVFFEAPSHRAESLIGSIVRVEVTRADRLSLHGRLV